MNLPVDPNKFRGLPINSHPGAFGCARKFNFHEGIDFYGEEGNHVYAIEDGIVVNYSIFTGSSIGFPWWLETHALLVKNANGQFLVYGEIISDKRIGDRVKAGEIIGKMIPVLSKEKIRKDIAGHSNVMLHLERYSEEYNPEMGWSSWESRELRPKYLLDPTELIIAAKINKFLTL